MLCLWRRTFNHMRRSLDGFTSMTAPIRDSGSCSGQLEPISSRTAVGLFGTVKLGLGRCFGLFGSNINRIPIDEKEPNPL